MPDADSSPRERILRATLALLDRGGVGAVSTRAVGELARIQAPTIYRLFGDKQGLLDAAAERGYADWVAAKGARPQPEDPVEALRAGWDEAVDLGVSRPALYRIVHSRATARAGGTEAGDALLREKVHAVAVAGRLAVPEDDAVRLLQATAHGITLTLLAEPDGSTALGDLGREAVLAAITTGESVVREASPAAAATALRALLPGSAVLGPAEAALMDEWLARIASNA